MTAKTNPIQSVQMLRAVAALLVVIGHALHDANFIALRTGQTPPQAGFLDWGFGVDIFFVISGFIMLHTSAGKFETPGAAREFLWRRLLRIAPLYWLLTTALIAGALVAPRLLNVPIEGWRPVLESYLFIPGLRGNGEVRPIMALGWTLNYEMFFYVFFACALMFPRRLGLALLTLLFLGLVAIGALFEMPTTALAFWADSIILEFLFGIAIAALLHYGFGLSGRAALVLLFLGALLAVGCGPLFGINRMLPRCLAAGLPAALIVLAAAWGPRLRAGFLLAPLVALGNASYSLYLSHPFVIRPLRELWLALPLRNWPAGWYVALCCVAAALAALALYRLVERPLTDLFARAPTRDLLPPAIVQRALLGQHAGQTAE